MSGAWTWAAAVAAAYLVGSIPFGLLVARTRGIDIRRHGSKNIGATNVGRVLGRRLGMLTFLLDMGKGAVPVLASGAAAGVLGRSPGPGPGGEAGLTAAQMWAWLAVAVAAVAGHIFPLYLRGRGGKGVATAFGALVAMWNVITVPALAALIVWYFVLRLTRYVSVASIAAAISLPAAYAAWLVPNDALQHPPSHTLDHVAAGYPPLVVTVLLAVMVIWMHRANLGRLRRGEEPQVRGGQRRGGM